MAQSLAPHPEAEEARVASEHFRTMLPLQDPE